jgi:hypothetical protein
LWLAALIKRRPKLDQAWRFNMAISSALTLSEDIQKLRHDRAIDILSSQ